MKSTIQQYPGSLWRIVAALLTDQPATLLSKALFCLTSLLSILLSLLLRFVMQYRKTVIRKNLTSSFPTKSTWEIRKLTSANYRHVGGLLLEPFLFYLAPERLRTRLPKYINPEVLASLHADQRPVVVFASHYGNWEYLINLPQVTDYPVYAAYSPIKNTMSTEGDLICG